MNKEALRARSLPAPLCAAKEDVASLSAREQEILKFLDLGLTNKQIAGKLYLSPETVKTYVARVLKKTGARNRTEAAYLARALLETKGLAPARPALKVLKAKL